ncbi:MAG: 3-deoxy-D-manno-octulosonic acid transferase [Coprobacter sp.]|nr:3-deoxy-D-manno-octulosonic acid transferase [Coprobacter sp.]
MRTIYNFGIWVYKQLVALASLRNKKARLLMEGHRTVFRYLEENADPQGGYIWIHASSLGEFEQGRPLIESIKAAAPEKKILVTFFSPSGYEVRKNYPMADLVCYLPFDLPGNVRRFLDIVRPEQAVFIKYEFWANYLNELAARHVPVYVVSAIFRPGQIFFKPYGGYFRKMLHRFTRLYVQDEASRQLLSGIGIEQVSVVGDTRFDRVLAIRSQAKELPLVETFARTGTVLVAGSSWPKDEDLFIEFFNRTPDLKLIIAPHEINPAHLDHITALLKRPFVFYSQADEESVKSADCLIVDCFGLLSSIYRYGRIAYVGGGFGVGIHNVPEAAVYGIPVIFGPHFGKFKEARELLACGGAFTVKDESELVSVLSALLSDAEFLARSSRAAGDYIVKNAGASAAVLKDLYPVSYPV